MARVSEIVRLEADPAREPLGQVGEERSLRLGELDPFDRPAGLGVAEVAEEAYALGLDQQRAVRALEADEIADVEAVRDEQRLLERGAESFNPIAHTFLSPGFRAPPDSRRGLFR